MTLGSIHSCAYPFYGYYFKPVKVYSQQAKAGVKAKKIKDEATNIKDFPFAWCERALKMSSYGRYKNHNLKR